LLTLYGQVVECQQKNSAGRILVHCLYGAERSGLFIAMMNMLDAMNAEQQVDVFNAVKRVRYSRPEMITDIDQYHYLYELARCYLASGAISEPPVDYPPVS
jgi:protein tyrosine phosphatase